ncbi:glycosyltransferase [Helicobacter sp. 23-1044]
MGGGESPKCNNAESANQIKIAESKLNSTHPLAPSAREGEQFDSAFARNRDSANCHESLRDAGFASKSRNDNYDLRGSIVSEKSGLCSHEQGNKTDSQWLLRLARKSYGLTKRVANLSDLSPQDNRAKLYLRSTSTQGKGAVIADAFALIEADIYIMIDADLECDTSILPRALQIFKEQNLDMLNIARSADSANLYRKGHSFGNALFTKIAQILFGVSLKDLLSGYRIFSRAFVKTFPATSKGFEIETELSVFALQSGLRIGEITAPYRSRVEGSFSKLRTFRDGFKILSMIMQLLFTERPLFVFGIASFACFIVAFALGVPLVVEFMQTSKVPRFPTAFICVGFGVVGVVLGIAGLLAHLVVRGIRENRRFFYLTNKKSMANRSAREGDK